MAKVDKDLVSEMTWSECVMNAVRKITRKRVAPKTYVRTALWACVDCAAQLEFELSEDIVADADKYLGFGWRYIRTKKTFEARCNNCSGRKKT